MVIGFTLACLTAGPTPAGEEVTAASASTELAAFVQAHVSQLSEPVIAVIPFRREDGSKSMEGQLIAERLLTELSLVPDLRIVERQLLEAALAEQKLGLEGFVSAETAARAGRLTGARGLLAGTITELGDSVEIHARLFSVESGEVIAAKDVTARRTVKTFISPLWDDIDAIKSKGNRFGAKLWTESDRLRIGDIAQIHFQVDQTCYVTVFDFATDGSITILFPNRFQPDNRLKAGRVYKVPADEAGYKLRVRGPAGIERLKLFATSEDVPLYVRDYSQSPFSAMTDGDMVDGVRGLQATVDNLLDADWAEASWEFLIENALR